MAIDFPASPTVGQQYTFNGVTYVYSSQGVWTVASASTASALLDALAYNGMQYICHGWLEIGGWRRYYGGHSGAGTFRFVSGLP